MSSSHPNPRIPQATNEPADPGRRELLGKGAAIAAVAVGAPAILAACDAGAATGASAAGGPAAGGPSFANETTVDPWWTIHKKLVATIGASTNVKVPTLERVTGGYLQRVVVDDERVGTGLATILKPKHTFDKTTLTVSVQDSKARAWKPRLVERNEDLVYAMCEGLSTNTLTDGVLAESLKAGNPVVAIIKPAVIQFFNSVASDYYGNHLEVASMGFCDLFNSSMGGVLITTTTRDLSRS
jgi:hypothetical protein